MQRWLRIVIALAVAGCDAQLTVTASPVSGPGAPNNLIPNPGFEANLAGWSASGWSFSTVDRGGGTGSALFDGSQSAGSLASATFPIAPSTQYNAMASFLKLHGGPTLQFKVVFFNSQGVPGDDVWAYSYSNATPGTWTEVAGPVMSPWYAVSASFQIVVSDGAGAPVYVDDVDLRKAVLDDSDPGVIYTGGTATMMNLNGWRFDATEGYYQKTAHWAAYNAANNPMVCHTFTGASRVGVGFRRQPDTGTMILTIDGAVTNTVDTGGASFGLGFRWANPTSDLALSAAHAVCAQPAPGATIAFDYFELSSGPMTNVNDLLGQGMTIKQALASLDTFATQGLSRTLYFPAGNYNIAMSVRDDCYYSGGDIPSHVHLFGDGADYTSIILMNDQPSTYLVGNGNVAPPPGKPQCASGVASVLQNLHTQGGDTDISVETLTIDGNSFNQVNGAHATTGCDGTCSPGCTGYYAQNALYFLRAGNVWARMARFASTKGTANCGVGESFSTDFGDGNLAVYDHCEAVGGSQSASGFSVNQSTNTSYLGCRAFGYGHANGFTHNRANIVRYTGCYAHGNTGSGFNSEQSQNVAYLGSVAGGNVPSAAGGWPYPWGPGIYMPNNTGFTLNQDSGGGNQLIGNFGQNNIHDLDVVSSSCSLSGNNFHSIHGSCQ